MINVFIDNNAWDIFYANKIDLLKELPSDEFNLMITREAEFEILQMPEEIRKYVESILQKNEIETDAFFGFSDPNLPPDKQRAGGFDQSRFCSEKESEFMSTEKIGNSKRPTGLYKHEADISLAARSLHSLVLTCDNKNSLKRAKKNHGGRILDLNKLKKGSSLASLIKNTLIPKKFIP